MVYHGFRKSASTLLNRYRHKHNIQADIMELCLDHRERNAIRRAYNEDSGYAPRIYLMQWWSDFLDDLRKGKIMSVEFDRA